ncbi:uncharacterized protein CC84DRAFT_1209520 [Paraphaeosphaeria sporulosa]|uniref:Uncharacterized protein n=1 Tax=Paraphaeosphaeria sporulosa TaxID=1460663 RepID=A0A177BZ04_9PLEO|nr:uncharacterized protein CC84DRAFT_1209520 [Paraphaeosphaeria sporulosa]OAG00603.1 hypothetical protein CC84DRAFT_1209520 [Paraphaeosphaeria sporulosa]
MLDRRRQHRKRAAFGASRSRMPTVPDAICTALAGCRLCNFDVSESSPRSRRDDEPTLLTIERRRCHAGRGNTRDSHYNGAVADTLRGYTWGPAQHGGHSIASMEGIFCPTSKGLGKIVKPDDIDLRRSERPRTASQRPRPYPCVTRTITVERRMSRDNGPSKPNRNTAVKHPKDNSE